MAVQHQRVAIALDSIYRPDEGGLIFGDFINLFVLVPRHTAALFPDQPACSGVDEAKTLGHRFCQVGFSDAMDAGHEYRHLDNSQVAGFS